MLSRKKDIQELASYCKNLDVHITQLRSIEFGGVRGPQQDTWTQCHVCKDKHPSFLAIEVTRSGEELLELLPRFLHKENERVFFDIPLCLAELTTKLLEQVGVTIHGKLAPKMRFEDCMVTDVETVREFVEKYYKNSRLRGRGDNYAESIIVSHEKRFADYGYDIISHHESVTGEIVSFFG